MQAEIIKTFRFDAAHCLSGVGELHKCRRLHGHGYRVDIHVAGPIDPQVGWVMDFADLTKAVAPVIEQLDHRYLNDVPGLEPCTAERIAAWIWDRVKPLVPGLTAVTVWETDAARAVYRGG
jgi:6-pyruvoyltetrahydropterin/6-carboxytetrahydropterin synthase